MTMSLTPASRSMKRFQCAGGASVAVIEGVHRAEMVVGGHGLDDAVVAPELSGDGLAEGFECFGELGAAFRAPADRAAESDVRSGAPQCAGLAMVVITAGDDAPVDVEDELGGDRLFGRREPSQR